MPDEQAQKTVALVIGSGSVKCAASLGIMRALRKAGIEINMVVGCSGGSIYAAGIALGLEVDVIQEMTLRLWTREITSKRRGRALFQAIFPQWFGFDERFGTVDDSLIMERLQAAYGGHDIADTRIPLFITATDFLTGEQVVLSEGSLVDAIRASSAIPYIFSPHPVGDHLLVDGFLSDPMPVGVAIQKGAEAIVAIGFESPYQERISSLPRYSFQISSIMSNNLLRANFAFHNLAHHAEVFPIIPEFKERYRLFDADKLPDIIAAGEQTAEAQMPFLQKVLFGEAKETV